MLEIREGRWNCCCWNGCCCCGWGWGGGPEGLGGGNRPAEFCGFCWELNGGFPIDCGFWRFGCPPPLTGREGWSGSCGGRGGTRTFPSTTQLVIILSNKKIKPSYFAFTFVDKFYIITLSFDISNINYVI